MHECIRLLSIILVSQQHSTLHDAATFSRLLCVNRRLHAAVMAAGVGRITLALKCASLRRMAGNAEKERSLVQWLHQHLCLQTLREVKCMADLDLEPILKGERFEMGWDVFHGDALQPTHEFLLRICTTLAAAQGFLGPRMPIVERWLGNGGY